MLSQEYWHDSYNTGQQVSRTVVEEQKLRVLVLTRADFNDWDCLRGFLVVLRLIARTAMMDEVAGKVMQCS